MPASLDHEALEKARVTAPFALAPTTNDANTATIGGGSTLFAIGGPGDTFICTADGDFHILAGTSAVTAILTKGGPIAKGCYKFTLPNGCTHVAMIGVLAGTKGNAWKG